MDDQHLMQYDQLGLIPGPQESDEEYEKRVQFCLSFKEKYELFSSPKILEEAFPLTENLYNIRPTWIPLQFSNQNLAPWHGGSAWIVQMTEESPLSALLQLRKAFSQQTTYLGIYDRNELIAHELAHAGRMQFEEPKFEELLAYRTSDSAFRRWVGPIIQNSKETLFFVILLLFIMISDLLFYPEVQWLKLFPLALILLASFRLWRRQGQLNNCLLKLKQLLDEARKANAVLYRLTDQEIILFSTLPPDEIKENIDRQKGDSLRRRLISLYFC